MKRSEKAERIVNMLEELYPETPVPLDHTNTFELLVAVLMSAQTTDLKVNQVTPALFAKANTPELMAQLPVETILNDIRQVGLAPTKAKNIRRLSELLVERHNGVVPDSFEALEALPGVVTRLLVWFLPKPLAYLRSQSTPTFIVLLPVGGSQTAQTWNEQSVTSKQSFPSTCGTNFICKSFSSEENIVQLGITI